MKTVEQNELKTTHVFDDYSEFRSEIGRICKRMFSEPESELRFVVSVKRNLSKSTYRQKEYIIELTRAQYLHILDTSKLSAEYAVPAAPDYPVVEKEADETVTSNLKEEA